MVIEWYFPESFSQSTIGGRNGSNACAFNCMYFGQVASKGLLLPRQGLALPNIWKEALELAIVSGNDLHDELFDHEGVDVNVDEPVEMAGEDCGVACLGQQKDLFVLQSSFLQSGSMNCQRELREHIIYFSVLGEPCS